MPGRNLYFGYFSRSAAVRDPSSVETWEDGQGRQVQVTAVFASEHEARGRVPADAVQVGRVLNKTGAGHAAVRGANKMVAQTNPADRSRRF